MAKKKKIEKVEGEPTLSKETVDSPTRVGNKVFIRTVTNFYTGEVVLVSEHEVVLRHAAWIADTKRFSESMRTGEFNEVEPYLDEQVVAVSRGGIIDVCDWPHELPCTVR